MAILRKRHAQYTVIPKGIFRDSRLNLRDVGLLCFMLHLPDDWDFSIAGLCTVRSGDGRDAIRKSVRRLEECGYLERTRDRTDDGKLHEAIWYLYDTPKSENPTLVKPTLDKPTLENSTQINTKLPITKELNTKNKLYRSIVDHLNAACGTAYRSDSRKTQSLIDTRLREGFTQEDFFRVIDIKASAWKDDAKMSKYLRPETLFGPKFEGYLNEKEVRKDGADADTAAYWDGAFAGTVI